MTDQSGFRAGLLCPDHPVPAGLIDGAGRPAGRRYDVYRNNVTVSLLRAMETAFPLVRRLIGPRRFHQTALDYVRSHPPTSPLMMFYGEGFPEFIHSVGPLSSFGYLPDAARLDLALRASYHAADCVPFDGAVLQDLGPQDLMNTRFTLAPATRILRSRWPLHDIWAVNQPGNCGKPRDIAQNVLITRPEFDPVPHPMPPGAATWMLALSEGATFASAHDRALAALPTFNLAETLGFALRTQAFAAI